MSFNYNRSVLNRSPREVFDPSNKKHMSDYAGFVKTSNWANGCNYYLEHPFTDIPTMIAAKVVRHTVENL